MKDFFIVSTVVEGLSSSSIDALSIIIPILYNLLFMVDGRAL